MFPQAVPAPAPPRPYSVSELLGEVGQALRTSWRDISVAGEIGRWELRGGHGYFNLRDRNGCLNAIIFASDLKRVPFQVKAGQEVVVRGSLDLFIPQGKFQIKVSAIEPVGAGALQLAFDQLKEKLAAEGLFEKSRKRPIPFLPRRIAIVTSPEGAAIRDILQIARRRFEGLAVTIYPARVQGAGAAGEIVEGIRALNRRGGFDVLVLARGGGSAEDLAAFNDERVARALAASQIPTISAIGHETDWTICDFVADLRAPTPSAAAELVVAAKEEVRRRVGGATSRVRRAMAASLAARQRDLGRLARADGLLAFPWKLRERREAIAQSRAALVDTLERRPGHEAQRLARASTALRSFARIAELSRKRDFLSGLARELSARMARTIMAGRSRLATAAEKLHLVSPLAVLARGYAIAWKDGKRSPILSADEVRIGDGIRVRLHEGEIRAVVRQGGVKKSSDLGPLFATETSGE